MKNSNKSMTEGGNIHEESSESEKNQTETDRADVRRQNHLLQLNNSDSETAEYMFIYSAVFIFPKNDHLIRYI